MSLHSRKKSFFESNYDWQHLIVSANFELQEYLNKLQQKIKNRIQQKQGHFLYAFKIHVDKIKQQMLNLKQKYENKNWQNSNQQFIIHLNKQCSLFRQEAMRLLQERQQFQSEVNVYKRDKSLLQDQLFKSDFRYKEILKDLKGKKIQIHKLNKVIQQQKQTITTLQSLKQESHQYTSRQKHRKIYTQTNHSYDNQMNRTELKNFVNPQRSIKGKNKSKDKFQNYQMVKTSKYTEKEHISGFKQVLQKKIKQLYGGTNHMIDTNQQSIKLNYSWRQIDSKSTSKMHNKMNTESNGMTKLFEEYQIINKDEENEAKQQKIDYNLKQNEKYCSNQLQKNIRKNIKNTANRWKKNKIINSKLLIQNNRIKKNTVL